MKVGDSVEGTILQKTKSIRIDQKTGEESELTRLFLQKENGEKIIVFEDGGMRNALANAMVKEGDFVKIVKLEKSDIGSGRTVNNYDIFTYAD